MNLHARFAEDERPIPELPGIFEVLIDSIDEIRVGHFEIQSCGQHKLYCHWEDGRIVIDFIDVKDGLKWFAGEYDKRTRFIGELIREHYATPAGQRLLRLECNAQDEAAEEDDGHVNAALERSREP